MVLKSKRVIMKTKHCLYCGEKFISAHGNQNYCPEKDCAYQAKLDRQNKNYEIGDDAKKAIQKNYILFLKILGDKLSGELDLSLLLRKGFNPNGYYGIVKSNDKKNQYFTVHDTYFQITSETPQKIRLWKQSKQ